MITRLSSRKKMVTMIFLLVIFAMYYPITGMEKLQKLSKKSGKGNTPGTSGWSRLHDQMLVIKSRKMSIHISIYKFTLVGSTWVVYWKSASWDSPKWVKSNALRKREKERNSVLTMASYACELNHGWRTQTTRTKIKNFQSFSSSQTIVLAAQMTPMGLDMQTVYRKYNSLVLKS